MAKWHGNIGFAKNVETKPGVYEDQITEREYSGDVKRITQRSQSASGVNDNITIANVISILADPFANDNIHRIAYIEFQGAKWKVSDVEVLRPRLNLTVGGVYNGQQA